MRFFCFAWGHSATKSDHLRFSRSCGPYQLPEKPIPLMIYKAHHDQPLPVHGKGINVRDWLYVEDRCRGILAVLEKGRVGEVYNLGGHKREGQPLHREEDTLRARQARVPHHLRHGCHGLFSTKHRLSSRSFTIL